MTTNGQLNVAVPACSAPAVFGYLRYPLVGQERAEFVRVIGERATACGGPLLDVYFEAAPPEAMLWALLEGVDRDWGADVLAAVTEYARAEGIDVRNIVDAGRVAPVQWKALVAELDRLGGGWVIMPSPRDLDTLGEPRHIVLQRLAAMNVHVAYLRDGASGPEPGQRRVLASVSEGTEIGQFRVSAFGLAVEVAKLSAQMYLNRAGLAYLVDAVTDLLGDLIGRRVEDTLVPGRTNEMTVQLLRRPDSLVVVVSETHDHIGEPVSARARAICGLNGVKQTEAADGGTVTRYWVALTDTAAFESAAIQSPA